MPTVPMWQSQVMKRQGLEGKQLLCGPGFDYNWVSITIQWEWQKFLGFVFAENEKSCGWNHFVGCGLCQPYPYLKYNGSAPYIWHALSACSAVWPDWANFRLLGGCLHTQTVFLITEVAQMCTWTTLFPGYKLRIYFDKKAVQLHFGAFFTNSPGHPVCTNKK
jgi:hypothetical protein